MDIYNKKFYSLPTIIIKELEWQIESNTKTPTISVSSPNLPTVIVLLLPEVHTIFTVSSSPNSDLSFPSFKQLSEEQELSAEQLQVNFHIYLGNKKGLLVPGNTTDNELRNIRNSLP